MERWRGGEGNDGGEEGDRGREWGGTRERKRSVIRQSLLKNESDLFRRRKCRISDISKASLRADGRRTGPDETLRTKREMWFRQ